ncbi:glycosyltransferase family 4 protein [Kocuria sp. CNJ-770]|uniref:glycosyltransferase family 4 protein n=1 Tax=Kocuria sp. CNJ-770 TaxID=1904964 RepID=UPI00111506A4|nr:glycosyltransferase family 4 protein [Kocuria sp. CNJ-770]
MSTIGIYSPNAQGHRFKYVQYLISHIPAEGNEVILLTTSKALQSPNYTVHLTPLAHRFREYILDPSAAEDLAHHARALETDLMVDPDGDASVWNQLWRRGWSGPGALSVLVMRPTGQSRRPAFRFLGTLIKRALIIIANARHNVNVFELKSSLWDSSADYGGVPDPISFAPDQPSLRSILPLEVDSSPIRWVGVVGSLTPRKNIELVLESAGRIQNPRLGIILAGKVDSSIKAAVDAKVVQLRQKGTPVLVLDRLLTDGQLDAVLDLLHCVVLAHSNEGPSGILGKAVEAGTYVVAAGAHSLRLDCQKLEAARWSPLEAEALTRSIEAGLDAEVVRPRKLRTESVFANRLLLGVSQRPHAC